MPQQFGDSVLAKVLADRNTPTIAPRQTGVLDTIRNMLYNAHLDQQPVVQVMRSPFGQVLAGSTGESMAPAINLLNDNPMGRDAVTFKKAFDSALDDYYDLPAGAPSSVRAPKGNAIKNIYNQIVSMGFARPQGELDHINQNVQDAKEIWENSKGYQNADTSIADANSKANMMLQHLKSNGYAPEPADLALLQKTIHDVQQSGNPSYLYGKQIGAQDRRLGELSRQVAGQLNTRTPLYKALRNATGWAQYEVPEPAAPGTWIAKGHSGQ